MRYRRDTALVVVVVLLAFGALFSRRGQGDLHTDTFSNVDIVRHVSIKIRCDDNDRIRGKTGISLEFFFSAASATSSIFSMLKHFMCSLFEGNFASNVSENRNGNNIIQSGECRQQHTCLRC